MNSEEEFLEYMAEIAECVRKLLDIVIAHTETLDDE